jgi:hypothetical protein
MILPDLSSRAGIILNAKNGNEGRRLMDIIKRVVGYQRRL